MTGFVTVNVYVPGSVTVAVAVVALKLPGPDQLNVTPGVADEPVKVTEVVIQVSEPDTEAEAPGVAIF